LPSNIKKVMTTNPATGHYGTTVNTAGNAYLKEHFSYGEKAVSTPNGAPILPIFEHDILEDGA